MMDSTATGPKSVWRFTVFLPIVLVVLLACGPLGLVSLTVTAVVSFVACKVLLTKLQFVPSLVPASLISEHPDPFKSDDPASGQLPAVFRIVSSVYLLFLFQNPAAGSVLFVVMFHARDMILAVPCL